ncbi:MAG TPA: ParB/RepB/Spo0J family partition protein [Candidatus Binatia bacterium]|nr:ParB/RepB/Spo0J family partition protein [Candidatus Binatia bacterium]
MNAPAVRHVPVDLIRPGTFQARRYFDPAALAELAESVRESGVISPVVLRSAGKGYELLAGERRWRAAQLAGLHEIPALVRDDLSDREALVLGLIENLQRESLTPIETAAGFRQLGELFQLTHEQIGGRVGKSREYVTNYLRLLNLAPPVQALVNEGHLSLGHAKVLAGLPADRQRHWAAVVVDQNLAVRALERRVSAAGRKPVLPAKPKAADWKALERGLSDQLGYPAALSADARGRGEIRVRFHSLDELDGLLRRLGYDADKA